MTSGSTNDNTLDRRLESAIRSGQLASVAELVPHDFLNQLDRALFGDHPAASTILLLAQGLAAMGLPHSATATLDRGVAYAITARERGAVLALRATLGAGPGANADRLASQRLLGTKGARAALPESRAGALSTLSIAVAPGPFRAVRDGFAAHPLREDPLRDPWLTKPARQAVQDDWTGMLEDLSFLVMYENQPLLHVECDIEGDGPLANLQGAIRLTPLCPDSGQPAFELAIRHLEASAIHAGAPFILMENAPVPALESWVRQPGTTARALEEAWIDLTQPTELIEKDFRETHRQQVRWGRKNLVIKRWAGPTDDELIDAYRALCLACQRPAPPPEFHHRLRRGEADLYVGLWNDEPVSGLIVGLHGATSYYESGLSLRRGNAPLSHAPLANAMIDAAQAGQRRFFLGALHVDPSFDAKLRSIAAFKKGFTRTTRPLTWTAVPVGG